MIQSMTFDFSKSIDMAIRRLVDVEHFGAGSIVSMPVVYPSGASVVLEMSMQKDRVFITDRGGGFYEAEYVGGTRHFVREAERIASDAGIRFDGHEMFVAEVSIDRIDGAMIVVANCSANAAALAALKSAEREEKMAKDALFDRLTGIYGKDGFDRDVKLIGGSNHEWRVDALVMQAKSRIIFNSVTKKYISAAGTAAKFYDLARLEFAPLRVAVVTSKAEIGDWYGVISSASDAVLELSAANDQYLRIGAAA